MGIRPSSLPNLASPNDETLILGVNVINETPNNSVKITGANLKTFIVSGAYIKANQSFVKVNSAYAFANTTANTLANAEIKLSSAYNFSNAAYIFANTTANTLANVEIKLTSAYDFSNTLYAYSNSIHEISNTNINQTSNCFIQANASFLKANASFEFANGLMVSVQQAFDASNAASIISQMANTNATVSYDASQTALNDAQIANTNSITALSVSNSAMFLASNNTVAISSVFGLANSIYEGLTSELNLYPIINAKRYNVIGDGITDETVNFQQLIDSIPFGTIFIPSGVYSISSLTLKPGITIKGDGCNTTILTTNSNTTNLLTYNKSANNVVDDIFISNIGFKANNTVNCTPIFISGNSDSNLCKTVKISDIKIFAEEGFNFENAVKLSNCSNYMITTMFSSNCKNDIILADSKKGQIVNNNLDSGIANNITETGNSNNNIISGNITRKQINMIGSQSIKSNNIENASD